MYYSAIQRTGTLLGALCSHTTVANPAPVLTCFEFDMTSVGVTLMTSSTKFFAIGTDPSNKASFIMMDITTPSADWNFVMDCPETGACTAGESAAILSSDNSQIHTLVPLGGTNIQLIFATLSSSTGSLIGNSQASSDTDCLSGFDMRLNGIKLYILALCSTFKLFVYDTSSTTFTSIFQSSTNVFRKFVIDFTGDK